MLGVNGFWWQPTKDAAPYNITQQNLNRANALLTQRVGK